MIIPQPIKLPDIDNYLEDLTAVAEKANMAVNLCLRARMAVSVRAQKVAYSQLAQVGTLLAKIYQAGDAGEKVTSNTYALCCLTQVPIQSMRGRLSLASSLTVHTESYKIGTLFMMRLTHLLTAMEMNSRNMLS